jgi:polyhydroxyalkanoate synthesis regulator phasin
MENNNKWIAFVVFISIAIYSYQQKEITALKKSLDAIVNIIDDLERNSAEHTSDIKELKSDVEELKSAVDDIEFKLIYID